MRFGDFAVDRGADLLAGAAAAGGCGSRHLAADRTQFVHDLAMHGADILVGGLDYRQIAGCFFDAKTSTMNWHEGLPELHSSCFKQMRFNVGFTPQSVVSRNRHGAHTND